MSEFAPVLPSLLAEYVLSSVNSNEQLHAVTLSEGDHVFASHLVANFPQLSDMRPAGNHDPSGLFEMYIAGPPDAEFYVKRLSPDQRTAPVKYYYPDYVTQLTRAIRYFGDLMPTTVVVFLFDTSSGTDEMFIAQDILVGPTIKSYACYGRPVDCEPSPKMVSQITFALRQSVLMHSQTGYWPEFDFILDFVHDRVFYFDFDHQNSINTHITRDLVLGFMEKRFGITIPSEITRIIK